MYCTRPGEMVTYGIHLRASRCASRAYRHVYVRANDRACAHTYMRALARIRRKEPHKRVSAWAGRGGWHRDNSRALTALATHRFRTLLSLRRPLRAPRSRLTVAPFTYGNAHRLTRDGLALIGLGWSPTDGRRRGWQADRNGECFTFDRASVVPAMPKQSKTFASYCLGVLSSCPSHEETRGEPVR